MPARRPRHEAAPPDPVPTSASTPGGHVRHRINRTLLVGTVAALIVIVASVVTAIAVMPRHETRRSPAATARAQHTRTGHREHTGSSYTAAPVLRVSGTTLTWKAIPHVTSYKLATVLNPRNTHGTIYRLVTGMRFSPPAVPGQTVNYGLEANVPQARWSKEIAIKWPAAPPARSKLKVGVVNTTGWRVDSIFYNAGIRYTRLDVGRGDLGQVTQALHDGITPLVLYNPGPGGGLLGVSPSQAASGVVSLARNLNSLAARYPMMNKLHVIEFGNEVYAHEAVATYAAQYDAAHRALAANGLSSWKLLAVGTSSACYSADAWIPDFINAMSQGASEVDGWTIHPYGSMTSDVGCNSAGPHGVGWPSVGDWHQIAVSDGSTAPWYITEVGQCIATGSACRRVVSASTQAEDMTQYLNDTVSKYPWVALVEWYTSCDDSTGEYGLLNKYRSGVCGSSARPAFTALQDWIAVNGEG